MLNWLALYPQVQAMAAKLAQQPEEQAYALLSARRQLWRMGYAQRGIPVVGEFCVMYERALAHQDPKLYAAHVARLTVAAPEEKSANP